jgi:hypothetical protein
VAAPLSIEHGGSVGEKASGRKKESNRGRACSEGEVDGVGTP